MMSLGIDPTKFLQTKDDTYRNMLVEVTRKAIEAKQKFDEQLAIMMANNIAKMMPR